jgi:hypothetical protein
MVERVLGKDEVTSSILVNGSIISMRSVTAARAFMPEPIRLLLAIDQEF